MGKWYITCMAEYMTLQVKAIQEAYQKAQSIMSIDQFAIIWIKDHAESFQHDHLDLLKKVN